MSSNTFFNELIFSQNSNISLMTIIVSLTVATFLSIIPVKVYQFKRPGSQYTDSFLVSLLIFGLLSSVITLVIGGNFARAFGLVGVLSIIRFRTALKSPMDAVFTFWSLTIGVACGTGNYLAGLVVCLFVSFVILVSPFILKIGPRKSELYVRVNFKPELRDGIEDIMSKTKFFSINETVNHESGEMSILFYRMGPEGSVVNEIGDSLKAIDASISLSVEEGIRPQVYAY